MERKWSSVSIPFKRESVSERWVFSPYWLLWPCFNSLQTGKRIWTKSEMVKLALAQVFQFPSNGKAYLNCTICVRCRNRLSFNSLQTGKRIWTRQSHLLRQSTTHHVSIPFKRESVSEPIFLSIALTSKFCFNSLQTGKRIWTGCLA